jgi:hypothetical protein
LFRFMRDCNRESHKGGKRKSLSDSTNSTGASTVAGIVIFPKANPDRYRNDPPCHHSPANTERTHRVSGRSRSA